MIQLHHQINSHKNIKVCSYMCRIRNAKGGKRNQKIYYIWLFNHAVNFWLSTSHTFLLLRRIRIWKLRLNQKVSQLAKMRSGFPKILHNISKSCKFAFRYISILLLVVVLKYVYITYFKFTLKYCLIIQFRDSVSIQKL